MRSPTAARFAVLRVTCRAALLLATVSLVAGAQTRVDPNDPAGLGTLTGRIHVQEGRHAAVLLVRGEWRVATGEVRADGTFRIDGPAGHHTLLARGDFCGPIEIAVTVRAGAVDSLDIHLPCSPIPCPKLDKSDPGCILVNHEERAKVGNACEAHPRSRLELDVVPLSFGIAPIEPGGPEARKQFPHARIVHAMGCVVGVVRWGEVAFCSECRSGFYLRHPSYLLRPIRPREVLPRDR